MTMRGDVAAGIMSQAGWSSGHRQPPASGRTEGRSTTVDAAAETVVDAPPRHADAMSADRPPSA
jgi:hypothetical protein